MNSLRSFGGSEGWTTSIRPVRASEATGAKSLTESNGSGVFVRCGTRTCELPGSRSVWPSGADLSSASEAITVLPPGLFSTITCWPKRSASFGASSRARMSFVPPGENGTRMRIGWVGKGSCASAPPASASRTAAAAARAKSAMRLMASFCCSTIDNAPHRAKARYPIRRPGRHLTPRQRSTAALAAATIVNLPFGTLYAFSVFLKPMEALLGTTRAEMSAVFGLATVTLVLGMNFAPQLYRRLPPALLAVACGLMSGAGLGLAASASSFAQFALGYGVLFGPGAGVLFIVSQQAVN